VSELIVVGMADFKTGKAPVSIITSLGSCIGVCIYSKKHKAGGMLHFMLSTAKDAVSSTSFKVAKYADTGIPELMNKLKKTYGIEPKDCVAKIFGGAKIIKKITNEIGAQNEETARNVLIKSNIKISAAKTGGEKGYKIIFNLEDGTVNCMVFGEKVGELF